MNEPKIGDGPEIIRQWNAAIIKDLEAGTRKLMLEWFASMTPGIEKERETTTTK